MTDRLKSCPFCGGEAKVYDGQVVCVSCWSGSACENTTKEAIDKWNTRKPMDRIVEQLEEVSFLDIDEMYADDGQRMLFLYEAIEIVKAGSHND